ncbi:MAG: thiamine-phosphate kinase [Desulfobulbaceae bacterium]|nr:MAG: thiamine-phosphate kinase [Desulfobulbaceae bacterium]
MGNSELAFIKAVAAMSPSHAPGLIRGIGDDCAVLSRDGDQVLLITTDTLVADVHFNLAWHGPYLLGRKAAAVNISDIAAMGGKPRYALLSAALNDALAEQGLEEFMAGFTAMLGEHDVVLIGGDTVAAPQPVFNVTLLGEMAAGQVRYRSLARLGDEVWVSGFLGRAAAGLALCEKSDQLSDRFAELVSAHLDPEPRVALGRLLAACDQVHAMMDLSDGLATDLAHICRASGVGADVDGRRLPLSATLKEAARYLQCEASQWALSGGEDYELLFTTAAGTGTELAERVSRELGLTLSRVGRITADNEVFLTEADGGRRCISFQGYEHHLRPAADSGRRPPDKADL